MLVLGAFLAAFACGSSKNDRDDSDSDDPTDAGSDGSGNAAGEPGDSGGFGGTGRGGTSGRGGTAGTNSAGAPGECSTASCGGDVVGTWEIVSSCVGSLVGVETCPGLEGDASGLKQTGTVTYNANSTYTSTTSATGFLTLKYPVSCIEPIGCDELATTLQGTAQGVDDILCTDQDDTCVCSLAYNQQTTTVSGSYTTNGEILLQMRSGSSTTTRADYCVDGDTLTLSSGATQSYVLERR